MVLINRRLRTVPVVFAILAITIMIVPMYARATTYETFTREISYLASGSPDEIQNNLDENSDTNVDTWDPVPSGVYFGGWAKESRFRMDDVPDTNYQIVLAQVCRFGSNIIMSGAGRTLVRLPIHTPTVDPWTSGRLTVYKISGDSNWTFTEKTLSGAGNGLDKCLINFTSGTHSQIFFSMVLDPTDVSLSDGNDHFTRSNRTYAYVDAPIEPDEFYLFVSSFWYSADYYVDIYLQSDTLDSDAQWNRSTIATYNELAPDDHNLAVRNLNISLGYSFDFINGFGNSAYGLNVWMDAGDEIEFWTYVPVTQIDLTWYPTLMVPFRSTTTNVSWDILIQFYDIALGVSDYIDWDDYICNDFILVSSQDAWGPNATAYGEESEWFRIILTCNNDTRIQLPLWNLQGPTGLNDTVNETWGSSIFAGVWDSDTEFNYNPLMLVEHDKGAGGRYNYHWAVQHSFTFNNYYWSKNVPPSDATQPVYDLENMTYTQKAFYVAGKLLINAGDAWANVPIIGIQVGTAFRAAGLAALMISRLDEFPDPIGWVMDGLQTIKSALIDFGQFLYRVAQSVVGALSWAVEQIVYYGSIILGILILILAIIVLFLPIYISAKIATMIVNASRGRTDLVTADMENLAGKASTIFKRG